MAAQENTAINNLLQIVAAQRVGFDQPRVVDRIAPPPPPPRPPVRPIFAQDDDDDAATQFVDRDDQSTNLVERDDAQTQLVDDDASTHFVERYRGPIPEATPRGAWSPTDMRNTAERMVDVVALRAVSRTAPPRAADIPSLRRPAATPRQAMEAPALSSAVAVHATPPVYAYAPPTQQHPLPPLGTEVRRTLRKLAAPITFVALFAISLSTYLAFAGGGDSVATAAAAPAPQAPPAAPVQVKPPPPPPAPAPVVAPAEAERAANVSANQTGEETPSPSAAGSEDAEVEIEMDAVGIERPRATARPRTAARELAPKKPEPKKPEPKKEAKKETKVEQAELPANVANKTSMETGTIVVTSNIPALIYLDGRNTGMMTPKQFTVPAGPHKITLLEPESKKARTQDVKVLPGKTASIAKQF